MADTELQFRTATFGGFQKQDVLLYIETMTREHREKLDGLQRKLDEAGEAQSAREGELAAAREREEKLGQELQGLREELSAVRREGEERQKELARLETELAELRREKTAAEELLTETEARLTETKEKLARAGQAAEAYEKIKDRTAGIELEAHCRAQDVQAEAEERAKRLQADVEQWLSRVQTGYGRLREDGHAAIGRARAEMDQAGGLLEEISHTLGSQAEQLGGLAEGDSGAVNHRPADPLTLGEN